MKILVTLFVATTLSLSAIASMLELKEDDSVNKQTKLISIKKKKLLKELNQLGGAALPTESNSLEEIQKRHSWEKNSKVNELKGWGVKVSNNVSYSQLLKLYGQEQKKRNIKKKELLKELKQLGFDAGLSESTPLEDLQEHLSIAKKNKV